MGIPLGQVAIVTGGTSGIGTYIAEVIVEQGATVTRATMSTLRVKLADNQDNREPSRVAALPGAADLVTTRYEPARRLLEAGLARRRDNQ